MTRGADSENSVRRCRVPAVDGFELGATVFDAPGADRLVLVNAATAVPQTFYRHFATYLAERNIRVVTFDYRGIGGSRPASLKGFEAKMRDWALCDMPAMLDWVHDEFAPRQVVGVGHSVGGQAAGLQPNATRYDALVTMSAQSGYWRIQGGWQPLWVGLAVGVVIPVVSRVFGYLPWSRLGASEDLPKGVALEWARWARDPDYLRGDESLPLRRFDDFHAPVLAYSIEDDDWGQPRAVDAMMSAYPNVERRHLVPAERGLAPLGHFGFFRRGAEPLWDDVIRWMEARS